MKKNRITKSLILSGLLFIGVTSCTNLEEVALDGTIQSEAQGGAVNTSAFLETAYNGLRNFQNQGQMFAMEEMSGDGLVGPTRGGDWDDNGAWRQLHTHTWDPVHVEVLGAWNSLLSNVYDCNQVIYNNGTASDVVQARFLRAFYYFHVADLFGQAPYRLQGSDPKADALVWSRADATAFCISELEAIVATLPSRMGTDPSMANKDAAYFLLAKLYLNKGIFDGSNTFAAADMTKVVQNVGLMTNTLSPDYWDNFSPSNNTSNELVFTSKNIGGGAGGNMQSRWRMGAHYNQTPGGWNGFSTVAEYYNRFGATDARAKNNSAYMISNFGNPAGFQVGQQFAPGGVDPLKDRNNAPLVFTPAVTMITGGVTIETAGIRVLKYIPDAANVGSPENDYVFMRYSDALLMRAEAVLRGGTGSAGTILDDLAARAGTTASPNTLDGIYAERGKELYWEGWRRNDMVRFGKFLDQRELKPYVSAEKYLLYPIPAGALLNPNLKQNPGY
jgi:hypothetical protein